MRDSLPLRKKIAELVVAKALEEIRERMSGHPEADINRTVEVSRLMLEASVAAAVAQYEKRHRPNA